MRKINKGFTLVELLVVISIIALLLAVMMPALSKAREQGRTVVCASNLKNYGLAINMYSNSNDGSSCDTFWLYSYKTLSKTGRDSCPGACRWHYDKDIPDGSLWSYLKNKDVHLCPTFRNFAQSGGLNACPNKIAHNSTLKFAANYSYSVNVSLTRKLPLQSPYHSLKLTNVRRPAQCLAFSEENLWTIGKKGIQYDENHHPARAGDGDYTYSGAVLNDNLLFMSAWRDFKDRGVDNIATYHKVSTAKRDEGMGNIIYVDGHVKAVRGLAGYNAYWEYGRPFDGDEDLATW
ncbi:MAG: hypothetical protein A2Y10_18675 [Planctomycetes bacterium GWF2_41_51]|nr:MAG: hypothetical protein A2Y10_18675 [Planctomycetes bacterium GWF2_41_51]